MTNGLVQSDSDPWDQFDSAETGSSDRIEPAVAASVDRDDPSDNQRERPD